MPDGEPYRPGWTTAEIRTLIDLFREGASDEHIAEVLDRSPRAVQSQRGRLQLNRRTSWRSRSRSAVQAQRIDYLREALDTVRALSRARATHRELEAVILESLAHDSYTAARALPDG